MREAFPIKLLLQLFQATPEQLVAIERILYGGKTEIGKAESRNRAPGAETHTSLSPLPGAEREAPRFVFRRIGKLWEVIFGGGGPFKLGSTLGTRYLDHFLHHPNDPISAFNLEVAIQPEKGVARSTTSIQPTSDARAKGEYAQALRTLRADQADAQEAGDHGEVTRLDGEIKALESALDERGGTDDSGERARGNVRRAIDVAVGKLLEGGERERAFAEHLRSHLSTGYECLYTQPEGRIWD